MTSILFPDKNNKLLKTYHLSSNAFIPLILMYGITSQFEYKIPEKIVAIGNIANIGFHSYVSCSCIITDYVKPPTFSRTLRITSLVFHNIAFYGFLKKLL